jgi:hypothetical protein
VSFTLNFKTLGTAKRNRIVGDSEIAKDYGTRIDLFMCDVGQLNFMLLLFRKLESGQSRDRNPGGGKIFCTCPDQPWGTSSLLYNGYWASFPAVKWPLCGVDHLPPPSGEVKERVELYFYSLSGPSWPVLG